MRLLIDMNLSPRWLALLAEGGFQAVHWSAIGRHNAPDREIMVYAAEHDFVVLTHDLDFGAILARLRASSRVWCRFEPKTWVPLQSAAR